MQKRLTPIGRTNPKFRYLSKGQSAPQQPGGAPSVIWSSCAIAQGGGSKKPTGGPPHSRVQTAFGFTEQGAKMIDQASGLMAGGALVSLSGVGAPVGLFFVTWGFIQAAWANTQYVKFERPCSENETGF